MQAEITSITSSVSTSSWKDIKLRIDYFFDYSATYPNAHIQYKYSQMHLWLHSYASYLNKTKARSRNGGYFHLTNNPNLTINLDDPPPPINVPLLVNSKIIDAVIFSTQESETGSGFINAKYDVAIHTKLHEMGHKQGPTPIQFDNKCDVGIITDTVPQHRSKSMDM